AAAEVVPPTFVVGETGSLVKETFQVGAFDFEGTKRLTEIAHEAGVRFKEHNVDYAPRQEFLLRWLAGVDAINVAPELAVEQTRVVFSLASQFGLQKELDQFRQYCLEHPTWNKWSYGSMLPALKVAVSAHYHYGSDSFCRLMDTLRARVDVDVAV